MKGKQTDVSYTRTPGGEEEKDQTEATGPEEQHGRESTQLFLLLGPQLEAGKVHGCRQEVPKNSL